MLPIPHLFRSLKLLLMLSILLPVVSANGQTNSEYDFSRFQLADDAQNTDYDGGLKDTVTKFDLLCLAANGYGQWTATTNSTAVTPKSEAGWYLLGNSLVQPSFLKAGRGVISPSYVAKGPFDAESTPTEMLVTANLEGRVRYVFLSTDRNSFKIQGLDDQTDAGDANSDHNLIDIDLTGYPYQPQDRVLTRHTSGNKSIFAFSDASTSSKTVTLSETSFRDRFDIACDKKFLYIVWRSDIGGSKIHAMAVNLTTGSTTLSQTEVDDGIRPTVACDVRNAPSTPEFEVAYLTTVNGTVKHRSFSGGSFSAVVNLPAFFTHPSTSAQNGYQAKHARILVSSIDGQVSTRTKGVYVIVRTTTESDVHLVMHHNAHTNDAKYVDGALITPPANIGFSSPSLAVKDNPIHAFANPYDNQTNASHHQLHCVYQLVHSDGGGEPIPHDPLVIVRSFDQATRLVLSTTSGGTLHKSIQSYVAAVNQMGIHVHWRATLNATVTHFYSRDMNRTFDEPIEENTLVTNTCEITDGTTHGGIAGARLIPGKDLTVWSNINYGIVSGAAPNKRIDGLLSHLGGLEMPHVGTLSFDGSNLTFAVGAATTNSSASIFTMSGASRFEFGTGVTTQTIEIHPNSTWEYFSILGLNAWKFNAQFTVHPKIKLLGLASQTAPPTLRLNGTAEFWLSHKAVFEATRANLISTYEPGQEPIAFTTGATSHPERAADLRLAAKTTWIDCDIEGSNPIAPLDPFFITIEPCQQSSCSDTSPADQFTAIGCNFHNDDATGMSLIQFNQSITGGTSVWEDALFDDCTFDNVNIAVNNPRNDFQVLNSTFDNVAGAGSNAGIFLTRSLSTGHNYENIEISGNTFETFKTSSPGIFVENFHRDALTELEVSDNIFSSDPGLGSNSRVSVAIKFKNSSGGILSNTITDVGYAIGIENKSSSPDFPTTNSLVCSNVIANANTVSGGGTPTFLGAGIWTSHHDGYSKLNDVTSSDRGHVSDIDDRSHIIFSDYVNNDGAGIQTVVSTARPDITGVHHPDPEDDYEGFNNITGNGESASNTQIQLKANSSILIGKEEVTWLFFGGNDIVKSLNHRMLIQADGSTTLGDMSNNYWGSSTITPSNDPGGDPGNWDATNGSHIHSSNINGYSAASFSTSAFSTDDPVCSGGFTMVREGSKPPEPMMDQDENTRCQSLYMRGGTYVTNGLNQMGLDTLKYYVESCPLHYNAWRSFVDMKGAVQRLGETNESVYLTHREWLLDVLYLNPDSFYYCGDVTAIIHTMRSNGERGYDVNGMLSVWKFLVDEGKCFEYTQAALDGWQSARDQQRDLYEDTVTNPELTPFDTAYVSLEELGLDLLRGSQGSVEDAPKGVSQSLLSVSASSNPFTDETRIFFRLETKELVSLTVHTVLGEEVYGTVEVFPPGDHEIKLNGRSLPTGILYARLTTLDGDVKTIKLIHR